MTAMQSHIPYGYRIFTGVVLSDSQVDAYNRQTDKVNAYIQAGKPVPSEVLNGRHNLFTTFAGRNG